MAVPAIWSATANVFAASAALLGLPEPDAEYWCAATAEAIQSWPKDVDASCVWTLTRGRAATNRPSAWIMVKQIPVEHLEQRHLGVSVMTAPRGFSVTTTPDEAAPWMIVGAKTLSYAANMAACGMPEAVALMMVIYVDGDCVLEGATSTVVAAQGTTLFTPTPRWRRPARHHAGRLIPTRRMEGLRLPKAHRG